MRRDCISGWLPTLLFVLIIMTAHQTACGKKALARISHNTIEKSSLFWYNFFIKKELNQRQGADT